MKLTLKNDLITPSLNNKERRIREMPKQAHTFFRAHTPIQTGNARRRTTLKNTTITADYPYAQPLDSGSSNQAPDGMTRPTLAYVKRLADQIIKRK